MAQKYYNAAEAAKVLGVSPADINEMVLRRELYGYKDGADWKFKPEDIERVAAERGRQRPGGSRRQRAGQRDRVGPVRPRNVRHGDRGRQEPFVRRERHPSRGKRRETRPGQAGVSDLNLLESGIDLAGPQQPAGGEERRRRLEGLAVRRPRHDVGPRPHAGRQQRRRFARAAKPRRRPAIRPSISAARSSRTTTSCSAAAAREAIFPSAATAAFRSSIRPTAASRWKRP